MSKFIFLNRFFHPDHSPTSQLLTDLTCYLAAQGSVVHVITSRQCYDDAGAGLAASEVVEGVHVHRVWTSRFGRDWLPGRAIDYLSYYISVAWRLARLLGKGDVVVAKTDPPFISIVAAFVAKLRGAKQVNWLQDLFPEVAIALNIKGLGGWFGQLLQRWRNHSLDFATVNVVLGKRMAECLHSEGVFGDVRVIHNWSDGEVIQPIEHEDNALRKEWSLTGKFVVVYSGNIGRAHEFGTILDAAELLNKDDRIVFLFIGDGQQRNKVQNEVKARGLTNVMFQPYQARKHLSESLGASDVHLISLLPSMEGLLVPSKFYGIAAAGRPTLFVGDPAGEVAQILNREVCGCAVSIGEGVKLRDRILALAKDEMCVKEMGINARAAFDKHYDKSIALNTWVDLLESVMALNKGVRGKDRIMTPATALWSLIRSLFDTAGVMLRWIFKRCSLYFFSMVHVWKVMRFLRWSICRRRTIGSRRSAHRRSTVNRRDCTQVAAFEMKDRRTIASTCRRRSFCRRAQSERRQIIVL